MYVEGRVTEVAYIDALRQAAHLASSTSVRVMIGESGAVPLALVEAARRDRHRIRGGVDQFWCVFDVESPLRHPHLRRAIALAEANDIRVAVSNPCFELWLILHHRDHGAHLSTREAVRIRRQLDGAGGKGLNPDTYMRSRDDAVKRAHTLRRRHQSNGTVFPEDNPGSSVDRFVVALSEAGWA
ncbi:RloB family protein [Mycetocola tolaasinivorans]|uniref:RloB family protein n=1 Tax=Mycetocola tolaasinivorans TaxID=76635 RepID=UPI0016039313|nr:RloB family protein [Mycetocola tolaasinivorans]